MLLFIVAYLGGVLTIVSPCILPVLPFVFARSDRGFLRTGLPLLAGMAATFTLVASLAAVGGEWAVHVDGVGRKVALTLLAVFGVTLLVPALGDVLTRPLVALGARLASTPDGRQRNSGVVTSLLLGAATGLLWAPCAGPILGVVLTGAALQGANSRSSSLLFAYALGAATSLALALLAGGRLLEAMKRSLGAGEWIRRGIGAALLCGVAAIALGLDTGYLARLSSANTAGVEHALLASISSASATQANTPSPKVVSLPVEGRMPSLAGATAWIGSAPLTTQELRGKVVLVNFWTYSCINCLRSLPYIRAWEARYREQGLVVVGVHAPEFAFEKNLDNVRSAVKDLKVPYPVAVDSPFEVWRAFDNRYWPAMYVVDAQGRIRHHQFGEGEYAQTDRAIRELLEATGKSARDPVAQPADMLGAQAPPDLVNLGSPETYLGYAQAERFASPGRLVRDVSHLYPGSTSADLNQWSLKGNWTIRAERATSDRPGGHIAYRFHARDLHLVLGPDEDGRPVRFRVSVDGAPPSDSHGADVNAQGYGTIGTTRLYQLIRQPGPIVDRLFEIEFLDGGAQAFAFTFG